MIGDDHVASVVGDKVGATGLEALLVVDVAAVDTSLTSVGVLNGKGVGKVVDVGGAGTGGKVNILNVIVSLVV